MRLYFFKHGLYKALIEINVLGQSQSDVHKPAIVSCTAEMLRAKLCSSVDWWEWLCSNTTGIWSNEVRKTDIKWVSAKTYHFPLNWLDCCRGKHLPSTDTQRHGGQSAWNNLKTHDSINSNSSQFDSLSFLINKVPEEISPHNLSEHFR